MAPYTRVDIEAGDALFVHDANLNIRGEAALDLRRHVLVQEGDLAANIE